MNGIWEFGYLLPHVGFNESIENGPVALVPCNDPQLLGLAKTFFGVNQLLTRFTDQFGETIRTSALLLTSDRPATVGYYAVASFRNCVAISSIIDGWVKQLTGGNAGYPLWSDYFDFYPFTVTADGDLSALSVASREINRPDGFRGQKTPYLPTLNAGVCAVDEEILNRLLSRWNRFFTNDVQDRATRILFRSLEVAYQAMRVPASGSRAPTIHEIGVGISLWVSAFEILSHPWRADANLATVLDLLETAEWDNRDLAARRYRVRYRNKTRQVNYVQHLYEKLYSARCDYLHGNPVTPRNLFPDHRKEGLTLLHIASLIYRAALDGHLPRPRQPRGPADRGEEDRLQEAVMAWFDHGHYENASSCLSESRAMVYLLRTVRYRVLLRESIQGPLFFHVLRHGRSR